MKNINISNKSFSDIKKLLGYLIESEEKSYEEYVFNDFEDLLVKSSDNPDFIFSKDFYNNPEIKHIYATARRVKDAILIQACDFKKKQYKKLFSQLNIEVEYIYVLSEWFKKPGYKDALDYIISVGCQYYFEYLPLQKLGLPIPEA